MTGNYELQLSRGPLDGRHCSSCGCMYKRMDFQQNTMTGKNDGDAHRNHSYDDLGFFQVSDCKGSIKFSVYGLATYHSPAFEERKYYLYIATLTEKSSHLRNSELNPQAMGVRFQRRSASYFS